MSNSETEVKARSKLLWSNDQGQLLSEAKTFVYLLYLNNVWLYMPEIIKSAAE